MTLQGLLVFGRHATRADLRRRFGGLTLLDRGVRTLARAGAARIVILAPAAVPVRVARLPRKIRAAVSVAHWEDGASLPLEGDRPVLVLQGDCVHHHSHLTDLVEAGLGQRDAVVQAGPAPPQPLSFESVEIAAGRLVFGGPSEATATGACLCSPALDLRPLAASGLDLNAFLAEATDGRALGLAPANPGLWRRVVDRRSARQAKAMLFAQVTKKTSGPISRHMNARFSIPISKLLIETGISPHLVTLLFVLTTGLASAYLMSDPSGYGRLALAGFLWHMAAVLDRCDGEVARVKLAESQFGAWFDTVTDNIAYFAMYSAILVAAHRHHGGDPMYLALGLSAVAAMVFTLGLEYAFALRTGSGSLQNYLFAFINGVPAEEKGRILRLLERYAFVAKRDFFSFIVFLLALTGQIDFIYWFSVISLHLLAAGALAMHRKMVLVQRRLEARSVAFNHHLEPTSQRAGSPGTK